MSMDLEKTYPLSAYQHAEKNGWIEKITNDRNCKASSRTRSIKW